MCDTQIERFVIRERLIYHVPFYDHCIYEQKHLYLLKHPNHLFNLQHRIAQCVNGSFWGELKTLSKRKIHNSFVFCRSMQFKFRISNDCNHINTLRIFIYSFQFHRVNLTHFIFMLTCIYISLNQTYFIQHAYGSIIYKYSMQNMFDAVHFGCLFRICNSIKSIVKYVVGFF